MALVASAAAGLEAARRGATILQLRAPDISTAELEREAGLLTAASALPVLVSSRLDVALAVAAAGVNLPEMDLPVAAARRLLGAEALIGRSVHSQAAAELAAGEGADFLVFGPVFATATHAGRPPAGLAALARVAAAVSIPVLAVGGVTASRLEEVLASGAAGYAAISAFRA